MGKKRLRQFIPIRLKPDEKFQPGVDEEARVLGGWIAHVLNTSSVLTLRKTGTSDAHVLICHIDDLISTAAFAINPKGTPTSDYTEEQTIDSTQIPFNNKLYVHFAGGSGSSALLVIEIVKIDPETGERLA